MAENETPYTIEGFEGIQRRSATFIRKRGQLFDGLNVVFSTIIGALARRLGSEKRGADLTSTTSTSTSTSSTTTSSSSSTTSTSSSTSTSTSTSTTRSTSTSSTSTSTSTSSTSTSS